MNGEGNENVWALAGFLFLAAIAVGGVVLLGILLFALVDGGLAIGNGFIFELLANKGIFALSFTGYLLIFFATSMLFVVSNYFDQHKKRRKLEIKAPAFLGGAIFGFFIYQWIEGEFFYKYFEDYELRYLYLPHLFFVVVCFISVIYLDKKSK